MCSKRQAGQWAIPAVHHATASAGARACAADSDATNTAVLSLPIGGGVPPNAAASLAASSSTVASSICDVWLASRCGLEMQQEHDNTSCSPTVATLKLASC